MAPRRALALMVSILMRVMIECQISNDFKYMTSRPSTRLELFRVNSHSEEHCIYFCITTLNCYAILYSASGSMCIGYVGQYTDGDSLDGAVAVWTSGKFAENYDCMCED